jgi:hypothetical protein
MTLTTSARRAHRSRRSITLATAAAAAITLAAPQGAATASPSAGADALLAWNSTTMSTLITGAIPIPEQPLYLAYVHRAVYSAVTETARRHASLDAAVVSAAHAVLVQYFPAQQSTLDSDFDASMAAIPDGLDRRIGATIGRWSAHALIQDRANDGRNGPSLPVPAPGPGIWSPTPPNTVGASSWLGAVRPFVLSSGDEFRAPAPPALSSARWATAYNEVRNYGGATSSVRTPAETDTAKFWTESPYVQNQRTIRAVVAARGLDTLHAARLFAMVNTAAADALIACFDTKYHYEFWRPFSAIPAGNTDGNPATPADASWTPLVPTPNHPEYTSAHSCATTAVYLVLAKLLAPHSTALDLDMDSTVTGTTHHFATTNDLISEVANARVWGGLHWRFSTAQGTRIGRSVAALVLQQHGNLH